MTASPHLSAPPTTHNNHHGPSAASPPPQPGWIDSTRDLTSGIRKRLHCDRILLGVVDAQRPAADELLAVDEFADETVAQWLEAGFRRDSVLRTALRTGAVSGTAGEAQLAGAGLSAATPIACIALPDGSPDRRHWLAIAARESAPFTDAELRAIGLHLRQWIARFNRPLEPRMLRLLVGNNDRVIHADPGGEAWIDAAQIDMKRVMLELRETAAQRWPEQIGRCVHDVVFSLSGQPVWIRFQRRRLLAGTEAEQWYLELRPIDRGDLPALGVLEDERIARAVGYIHDEYATSPGLDTLAGLVEVSPFHFHRTFAKLTGTTPKQYVLQRQVQMAKWMLAARRGPISAIADATGFASHGHFTSTFRRMQNMSPSEYREQLDFA